MKKNIVTLNNFNKFKETHKKKRCPINPQNKIIYVDFKNKTWLLFLNWYNRDKDKEKDGLKNKIKGRRSFNI